MPANAPKVSDEIAQAIRTLQKIATLDKSISPPELLSSLIKVPAIAGIAHSKITSSITKIGERIEFLLYSPMHLERRFIVFKANSLSIK